MDRLTNLTVFSRVVECGGFSAAARRLGMSVSAVSTHVQALENRLGARLLNRTTRRISLTEVGRDYHERAVQILADLEEADHVAGASTATPRGTLRLHASVNIMRVLAPMIADFMRAHPAVSIDLAVGDRMVDVVDEGYDLVIRPVAPPDSNLIVRCLTTWRHVLCCAPSYLERHAPPRGPSDLADHNCLQFAFYPFGSEWRFEGPDGRREAVRVRGNVTTGSADLILCLAKQGRGLFLAPPFIAGADLAAGTLVQLLPDHRAVEMEINAVFPSRHNLSSKVRTFLDVLAEQFASKRRGPGRVGDETASLDAL